MLSRKSSTNLDLTKIFCLQNYLHAVFFAPVVIISGVESDDNLPVPPLTERDAVAVVRVLEQRHHHPRQRVRATERVGHAVLTPGVDLCNDKNIIE